MRLCVAFHIRVDEEAEVGRGVLGVKCQRHISGRVDMKKTLVLTALSVVVGLSGCATQPVTFAQAKPVPPSRLIAAGSGDASILIKRDSGFVGGACNTRIYMNGTLSALLGAGEVVQLRSKPGAAIIGAEPDGMCGGNLKELAATLDPTKDNRFRVLIDQGHVHVDRADRD